MKLKRVVVTGASGFIGGAIATALADAGHEVVGVGRRPNGWQHRRGRYRIADLSRGPLSFCGEADVVVHAAALADDWAPYDEMMRHNVLATRRLVMSAPHARFVHISSASVYDAFQPNIGCHEDECQSRRFLNAYGATKALAEREVARHANAIILRPHAVYGPGDTTLLPRILDRTRRGVLVLPAGGRVEHTVTHIDTMLQATLLSLESPVTGPVNVGDAEPVTLRDFLAEALERQGLATKILGIPPRLAMSLASRAQGLAQRTGQTPAVTRYAVSQVGFERTYDLTRLRTELRAAPRMPSLDFLSR